MSVAIVTGSCGLIGSEASRHFARNGYQIVGIDNDARAYFFGELASTYNERLSLADELNTGYDHYSSDIRSLEDINQVFDRYGSDISLVVHTAAQPSHDWAARAPLVDFGINAVGTINLLEATRKFCPRATFIFTSTNKVYGDRPNNLHFEELETRFEPTSPHLRHYGINENFPIDQSTHSVFGASKVAADVMVQEYGRYFGMNTGVFRGGCLTGPAHRGTKLHGFLSYLVTCVVRKQPYEIIGYKGKQVRDNIASSDVVTAFHEFHRNPRPGEVYNLGGGRFANCSVLEAITLAEEITGNRLDFTISDVARKGDHQWYISDMAKFRNHYPAWEPRIDIRSTIEAIAKGVA